MTTGTQYLQLVLAFTPFLQQSRHFLTLIYKLVWAFVDVVKSMSISITSMRSGLWYGSSLSYIFLFCLIYEGCPSKSWTFVIKKGLSIRNSMKFVWYVNIHLRHIFHKYGRNHSLDIKVMKLYLRVSLRMRSTSQIILLYFQRGVVKCFDSTLFK